MLFVLFDMVCFYEFNIWIFPILFVSCFPSVRKESELFADWRENRDKLVTDYKRKRKDAADDDEKLVARYAEGRVYYFGI